MWMDIHIDPLIYRWRPIIPLLTAQKLVLDLKLYDSRERNYPFHLVSKFHTFLATCGPQIDLFLRYSQELILSDSVQLIESISFSYQQIITTIMPDSLSPPASQ